MDDATLTLWKQTVDPNATSEDSIRSTDGFSHPIDPKTLPCRRIAKDPVDSSETIPDYTLRERLGTGGMGTVYAADQCNFKRSVAIKMARTDLGNSSSATAALGVEALVTGNLDHPNIVPIHDLCVDEEGNIFFVMKEVHGHPWSVLMDNKSLEDNLEILLRVADTVAYAHSKGILHRDLKPQNIMIGDFGEIMVMDWGASCAINGTSQSGIRSAESSNCGTPVYMPPEMARCDINRVGVTSDVYLLGALLYHIVSGHPPRREKDPVCCLAMAAENAIEAFTEDGELQRVALKAMAALPSDRYPDVKAFQQAVRNYRAHAEGLQLIDNAKEYLSHARATREYELFNRVIYGLRQAGELWPENASIQPLLHEAQEAYARCAMDKDDYELAKSLLDQSDPEHAKLLEIIRQALDARDLQIRHNRRLKRTGQILLMALLLFFAAAFFMVRAEQRQTELQRVKASIAHRQSLMTLLSAQFAAREYEAATSTFWELYDEYGMEDLDQETLLNIRISAAMNPWRGAIDLGIGKVLGIVPARQKDNVWAVGNKELLRIALDRDAAWVEEPTVSIHDFSFGKRKAPGRIVQTIALPFELANAGAFYEGHDGTLWAGSNSTVYRRNATDGGWVPVLEVDSLDFAPLPAAYELDTDQSKEVHDWMVTTGRSQPITGLVVTRDASNAGIALGGGAFCWVDMIERQVEGWLHANLFPAAVENKDAHYPLRIMLSEDERYLAYLDGVYRTILIVSEVDKFLPKAVYYSREYQIRDLLFNGPSRLTAVSADDIVFSVDEADYNAYGSLNHVNIRAPIQWGPEVYLLRRLDDQNLTVAAFNRDGSRVCALSDDRHLYAGSSSTNFDFNVRHTIVPRSYKDACLSEDGFAVLLDSDARVHVYDVGTFSVADVDLDGEIFHLSSSMDSGHLNFTTQSSGIHRICSLDLSEITQPVLVQHQSVTNPIDVAFDPAGQYYAYIKKNADSEEHVVSVCDLEGGNLIFSKARAWCDEIRFSEDGRYLITGDNWSKEIIIYSMPTGERSLIMKTDSTGGYPRVLLDQGTSPPRVIAALRTGWTLSSHNLAMQNEGFNTNWVNNTSGVTMSIIPFKDQGTKKEAYWCRTWFGDFEAHSAETGEPTGDTNDYWYKKSAGLPVFKSFYENVAFKMEDGRLQICMKTDMYPIFDPDILSFKTRDVVFSTDASLLYLYGDDGKIHVLKMPRDTE